MFCARAGASGLRHLARAQPGRLRPAQPELWLALSSSHAPEHLCAGARPGLRPSVGAVLAMQIDDLAPTSPRSSTILPSSFRGPSTAFLLLQIAILIARVGCLTSARARRDALKATAAASGSQKRAWRLPQRTLREVRVLQRTCVEAECLASDPRS